MGSCLSSDGGRDGPAPATPTAKRQRKGARKRKVFRSSSFDSKAQQLHRVPGRMFVNGASGIASLFTQQGKKGTNQDAMIVWENFGSRTDTVFCGVFDGHGPYGHIVARNVRDHLPLKLSAHWEVNIGNEECRENSMSTVGSMNSDEIVSVMLEEELNGSADLEEKDRLPEIFTTLKESFLKAFKVMDKELKLHPNIDCFCSGTTAVTLVKQGQDLVIGNVGDSRAVLGTRDHNDCLIAVQLTVDLKPNLPREAERIRQCKGRVFALRDEPEVARVWLPHNDSPGLAMARAFGDFCLKDFGLISVPEITYRHLTERDEFVVLATDGLWDVLSNKEVVDIVASAPTRSIAARSLVESAVRAWRFKYPTSKIDDCAVVCLFLDSDTSISASNHKTSEQGDGPLDVTEVSHDKEEIVDPTGLGRSGTVRASPEIQAEETPEAFKQSNNLQSSHQSADGDSNALEGDEWSALEGVSRVNSLLTIPRVIIASGKQATHNKIKK
ncbi:hypothetical protein J5N97_019881 [Dioscorea zingiberensis]|uniref:protein-serine/threonine phosphatase n=1 Tax=Dioscorea zingiberensis TaxID=325984 RepID=A0A9D5CFW9_9LILI|nr:hypothetical protein J5N97_019881 [Dioscorea zingiberensis]